MNDIDTIRPKQIRLSDTRELKDLRRLYGTGRNNHLKITTRLFFPSFNSVDDTDRALTFSNDILYVGIGFDVQVARFFAGFK